MKDKRQLRMDCLHGTLTIKRNYYFDREKNHYVCLLDQLLQFEGGQGLSPAVEEMAMTLAATGPSYRHAADSLEQMLGYKVISHEAIRQHLLQTDVMPRRAQRPARRMLFIEVDGIFIKRQGQNRRGREEKIAAIHEGWETHGKRTALVNKRHYVHRDSEGSFWEGLETFLMDTYDYQRHEDLLLINGDGANWITACQVYFKDRACFTLDRFHVARDIRSLFLGHKRYRAIRRRFVRGEGHDLLTELNSALGTLDDEGKEEKLERLIGQLAKRPEAIGDYRAWLEKRGHRYHRHTPDGQC